MSTNVPLEAVTANASRPFLLRFISQPSSLTSSHQKTTIESSPNFDRQESSLNLRRLGSKSPPSTSSPSLPRRPQGTRRKLFPRLLQARRTPFLKQQTLRRRPSTLGLSRSLDLNHQGTSERLSSLFERSRRNQAPEQFHSTLQDFFYPTGSEACRRDPFRTSRRCRWWAESKRR